MTSNLDIATVTPSDAMAALGVSVVAKFVPFSQSRHKGDKAKTLNWSVTIQRHGRDVLTCDYSAGIAHCPGYSLKVPATWNRPARMWQEAVTSWECEHGFAASHGFGDFRAKRVPPSPDAEDRTQVRVAILPKPEDVLYSMVMDSNVLDHATFESWASEFGYDADSRAAESIYRACLAHALALRAALGDAGIETLRNAFQDY